MNDAFDEFRKRKSSPGNRPVTENTEQPARAETSEPDEIDFRAYGANRNGRQVIMLDVRTLKGERFALGYSYLNNIFFDESGLLVLSFPTHIITIEGQTLAPLYEKLLTHSVRYIQQENPELERNISSGETFISLIHVEKVE